MAAFIAGDIHDLEGTGRTPYGPADRPRPCSVGEWLAGKTLYARRGHRLSRGELFSLDIDGLPETAERLLSRLRDGFGEIARLIGDVPDEMCRGN